MDVEVKRRKVKYGGGRVVKKNFGWCFAWGFPSTIISSIVLGLERVCLKCNKKSQDYGRCERGVQVKGAGFFAIHTRFQAKRDILDSMLKLDLSYEKLSSGERCKTKGIIGEAIEHCSEKKIQLDECSNALFKNKPIQPVILDQNYIHLKNLIIKAERRVLKELGFCVHIKHPHKIIVMYLQVLGFQHNQKLMQYSWNYMNDSLRTDVFVRYQPETVACACIYLTARKLKLPLPKNPYWYTIFGATEAEIRDICIRILKLYDRPKGNIETLEKKVDELCKKYQDARAKARGGSGNNTPNNNDSSSPSQQKTTGAHNAWGGFISRSGSHIAPPVSDKRSRSRSGTHSPENKHRKRSKKHRSRSRSTSRNHKKSHKRKSYSRSRSTSPHTKLRKRDKRSPSNDRESKNDRYADKYEKSDKDRYKEERDRDRYSEKDRYDDKKDRKERYDKEDKYDKYSRDERDRYKKSKHRDEEKTESRSKDRRR